MRNNADEMKTQTPTPRRLTRESGMTLIEMLVGITVTLGVLMAAFPIIDGAASTEGRVQQSAQSVGDARVFSDQVLRDLRPTYQIGGYSSTGFTVYTYVRHACGTGTPSAETAPATACRVVYSCAETTPNTTPATYECARQESNLNGSGAGPSVTMATGLSSDSVFSYPATTCDFVCYVGIKLVLPNDQSTGGDAITLHDGTALRNVGS
jgi:type II secretory pathway pseudopilin PulG